MRAYTTQLSGITTHCNIALNSLTVHIRITPDDGVAYYQLGCTYLLLEDKAAALAEHGSLENIVEKTEDYLLKTSYQSRAEELLKKIQD